MEEENCASREEEPGPERLREGPWAENCPNRPNNHFSVQPQGQLSMQGPEVNFNGRSSPEPTFNFNSSPSNYGPNNN